MRKKILILLMIPLIYMCSEKQAEPDAIRYDYQVKAGEYELASVNDDHKEIIIFKAGNNIYNYSWNGFKEAEYTLNKKPVTSSIYFAGYFKLALALEEKLSKEKSLEMSKYLIDNYPNFTRELSKKLF